MRLDSQPESRRPRSCTVLALVSVFGWLGMLLSAPLAAQELREMRAANLGSDQTQLSLRFSSPPPEAATFVIESPPRVAIDLPGVVSRLPSRVAEFNMGPLLYATAVEASDRTRVVLNLARSTDYQTRVEGNTLIVVVGSGAAMVPRAEVPAAARVETPTAAPPPLQPRSVRPPEIVEVDFRRGTGGQGRLVIDLSHPGVSVELQEQAGRVELLFPRVFMDERFERRIDVTDFATPVTLIDTVRVGDDRVRMTVNAVGEYDVLSYQTDRTYVLELAPITAAEREAQRLAREEFIGERLSLNFQDIEVRSVLQLLADFTDLNIVANDSVRGNVTLRLNNVPWDQAMQIILDLRGLGKVQSGNVIYVAPVAELAALERARFEALRVRETEGPLTTEYITVNFTQATTLRSLIEAGRGDQGDRLAFLSSRGSVAAHTATNTLIVRDTVEQIEQIRRLVATLDVPTRQVLIETRVVIADENYRRDLGVRFGVSGGRQQGSTSLGASGTLGAAAGIAQGIASGNVAVPALPGRLNVALPAAGGGSFGFSILNPNVLLDLELSALQTEGRGEVIASPRVITANGQKAVIKQGQEIPFLSTSDGGTNVQFRDALLETEVTPQITPNGNVIMNIKVTKNEPNFQQSVQGNPSISKREVETQVVVANGETVVLGGVYEITSTTNLEMVPFFGELPFLGAFFRNRLNTNVKAELLIFVTPRVLD